MALRATEPKLMKGDRLLSLSSQGAEPSTPVFGGR